MLSHYRSSESQLRELSQLAPAISISQTMDDFGFSGGYVSRGVDHNLHDHMVQMFIRERDLKRREQFLGLTTLKFSQMSTQWANPAPKDIRTGMTSNEMDQGGKYTGRLECKVWNQAMCSLTGSQGRITREGIKQHLHTSYLSESELFSFPHCENCICNSIYT